VVTSTLSSIRNQFETPLQLTNVVHNFPMTLLAR
jgi:hypothetical protein